MTQMVEIEMDAVHRVVASELKDYYSICRLPNKIDCSDDIIDPDYDLLKAIERVLEEYMTQQDYEQWLSEKDKQ